MLVADTFGLGLNIVVEFRPAGLVAGCGASRCFGLNIVRGGIQAHPQGWLHAVEPRVPMPTHSGTRAWIWGFRVSGHRVLTGHWDFTLGRLNDSCDLKLPQRGGLLLYDGTAVVC